MVAVPRTRTEIFRIVWEAASGSRRTAQMQKALRLVETQGLGSGRDYQQRQQRQQRQQE
jgi:hypothetical protein